jgi:hypothetical protein
MNSVTRVTVKLFLIPDLPDLPNLHVGFRPRRTSRPSDPKPDEHGSVIALQVLMRRGMRIRERPLEARQRVEQREKGPSSAAD